MPLGDLQDALACVELGDRLTWHRALLDANDDLAAEAGVSQAGAAAAEPWVSEPHPPTRPGGPSATPPSSALAPGKVLEAFAAPGELALADRVAAAAAAAERGLPLHGIELDDPGAYQALLAGPLLTRGSPPSAHNSQASSAAAAMPGRYRSSTASTNSSVITGSSAANLGVQQELACEQLRMALGWLQPGVAAAFGEWMDGVPQGPLRELLQYQLAGLAQQCLDPESYLSYVDEVDTLCADERRVGAAAASQYRQLTVAREAHFLRRLGQVAASGARGRLPARRIVAVLGRAHAARLRRALLEGPPGPPPGLL